MFSTTSGEMCQSRYFKEWHPDYISSYNSLRDKNLRHYFNHPARKNHLTRNNQISASGEVVNEKEWRRQNLEWERRRREAEQNAELSHQREVDKRRARMCLRQQQRDEDYKRKKADKGQDLTAAVKEAWADQEQLLTRISTTNRRDIEHLLNFLNFEIKYILRPRSAPNRYTRRLPPNDRRAQSARRPRSNRRIGTSTSTTGYPKVNGVRTKSLEHNPTSMDDTVFGGTTSSKDKGEHVRNIEVPEREFSRSSQSVSPIRNPPLRPSTAPVRPVRQPRARSPSHPNYKEEAYLQSTVVLRYVGHTDHYARLESRARHRAHRKSCQLPPLPAHVDEVTIEQQPRGSYVLEVFHGYLSVGDEFRFTSRRCDGYPFSLTIYVNRQCHVRLSTCCETKRTVGARLGQGCFQLLHVQDARPCIRCILERDPIAQKHVARIQKLRGSYDEMGNRVPPPQEPVQSKKGRRRKKNNPGNPGSQESGDEEDVLDGYIDKEEARVVPIKTTTTLVTEKKKAQFSPDTPTQQRSKSSKVKRKPRPKSAPKHNRKAPEYEDFSEEELKLGDEASSVASTAAAAGDENVDFVDKPKQDAKVTVAH